MTILETADLHLNDNPRDAYRHTFMAETLPALIRKYGVDYLFILGDVCDEKDRHSAWLVNRVVEYLTTLSKLCEITILRGNHDYVDVNNPFYEFVGSLPKIHWINQPTERGPFDRRTVLFLPHTGNYARDWKGLDFSKFKLIYTHQTFAGADVGARKLEGIPLDVFPDTVEVVSGDVHVPQTFDVVTYIGAPYTCNFGDAFKPRVLLRDDKSVKSIPVPGVQKRLLEIGSLAELKHQRMLSEGDILKVRVALKAADHARWPEMKAAVEKWGAENGYQICLVQPDVKEKGKATARPRASVRTDEQLMGVYAKARAVSETTLKTGMTIMRRV